MIEFSNGYKFDFGVASGALAFHGEGWWFEQPWRWLGLIRPEDFTIIVKTLTFTPREGQYKWYKPWQAVRLLGNGDVVNAVRFTNKGYKWWCGEPYQYIRLKGYKVIVSFAPETVEEAEIMTKAFNCLDYIVGIQLNPSCPNVNHDRSIEHVCKITKVVAKLTKHPLSIKLGYQDPHVEISQELDGIVEAIELINSVPFPIVFPGRKSPLQKYGTPGGVSGNSIKEYARRALYRVKRAGVRTPIISGGGIDCQEEVDVRDSLGAEAIVFGSIFIRRPWRPNVIVGQSRQAMRTPKQWKYPTLGAMNDLIWDEE